jgi:hypothetical protein
MNCALAIERSFQGDHGVFVALFRAPEHQTICQLQGALEFYKNQPLDRVGVYRRALKFSRVPRPIRRLFWWSTLNFSGPKRAKRFGTFGLTSYGALGAESLHPISPLTTTLTFGPISDSGEVIVKLIYDHRVLDGAYVARRLRDIESALQGPVLCELRDGPFDTSTTDQPTAPAFATPISLKLHRPSEAEPHAPLIQLEDRTTPGLRSESVS